MLHIKSQVELEHVEGWNNIKIRAFQHFYALFLKFTFCIGSYRAPLVEYLWHWGHQVQRMKLLNFFILNPVRGRHLFFSVANWKYRRPSFDPLRKDGRDQDFSGCLWIPGRARWKIDIKDFPLELHVELMLTVTQF